MLAHSLPAWMRCVAIALPQRCAASRMAGAVRRIQTTPPLEPPDPPPHARSAMDFLDRSPDPFHVTHNLCERLIEAGFVALDEKEPWHGRLEPGGRYFYTRNRSCLVAFAVGGAFEAGHGFKIIGAHTDSPNLKVKPRSKRDSGGGGVSQLSVETYGGGLWHTWFDRDLSVSGRVIVRGDDGAVEMKLVRLERPVLRVPTLCIHLQSPDERKAFEVNKEDHLQPILAMAAERGLTTGDAAGAAGADGAANAAADGAPAGWEGSQDPLLVSLISEHLGVQPSQIADFELNLYDTHRAAVFGGRSEFLVSARLDNLASCYMATEARHMASCR